MNETFDNVIFTDETTIQLEQHSRVCFRKTYHPRTLKPHPKHSVKIHVWGGISKKGATRPVMFTGNMNARRLKQILQAGLVPFINEKFPDIFEEEGIFWWPTPPRS